MENTSPIRSTSSGDSSSSTQSGPRRNASTSEPARRKSTISTVLHQPSDISGKNAKPKQSLLEKATAMWIANTGIDSKTYRSMFKSAVAPTITLALFQVDSFASYYTTQGYLAIIMTILTMVIMPRAKLLQTLLVSILLACLGAAVALLAIYCCVAARRGDTNTYNSSASAVAAVWLGFQVFWLSVLRAKLPQYNIPCIMWAIFANVSMIYGPQFATMALAESFVKNLLVSFFTGFGIGAGVSLLVFPTNSRQVAFAGITSYIASLRGALQANLNYMHSLEREDMFAAAATNTIGEKPPKSAEARAFKQKMASLSALHGKLTTDLPFAKREVAMGKIGPMEMQETFRLLRMIMIPTVGLSCMADIFVRIAETRGWDRDVDFSEAKAEDATNESEKLRIKAVNDWHALMKRLREPFGQITQTIDDGLEHVRVVLQLGAKTWKKTRGEPDVEKGDDKPKPGDEGFAQSFLLQSNAFHESKQVMLREWSSLHGIELPEGFFDHPEGMDVKTPGWMQEGMLTESHKRLRRQLFLCLYMEFLLISIARRTYNLIVAVDTLRANGKLDKKRLIVPGYKRSRKWFMSLFRGNEDAHDDNDFATDGQTRQVYLGDAYQRRKDPEHLPPVNAWEKFGDNLRKISHFFQSPAAAFALRATIATMSIAIISYLRDTQAFATSERLFWAQIMASISMVPTAGQSLRSFFFRAIGTGLAMVTSLVAWYIVDEHTAGIIVFFFVVQHIGAYIMLKYPVYIQVGVIFQITNSLIVGYELEARKLGVDVATSNGQAYYPIYVLGPIRLATVCAGILVAWIFTWFPYPISEHNVLRKQLGSSLYLLANYYSVMHETLRVRLRNAQGDMASKHSPGRRLEKARNKIYSKASLTIASLRGQAQVVKFDIPIGGKFPQERYSRLVNHLQSILNFMSLVSVASYSFQELRSDQGSEHGFAWLRDLETLLRNASYTSEQVTTLLTLLSASITTQQALPPYLRVPEPFSLSQKLDDLDQDILSIRHIAEPGYASFAVVQIGTRFIYEDLHRLVAEIKELVGELDFSFHIVSTSDPSREEEEERLVLTKTRDTGGRPKQD